MSHLTFKAEIVARDGAIFDLVVSRGAWVTDLDLGFDRAWDWQPYFRCNLDDAVILMGPDVWLDHAGAIVERTEPLRVRLVYGALGTLRYVVRGSSAAERKRWARASATPRRARRAKEAA